MKRKDLILIATALVSVMMLCGCGETDNSTFTPNNDTITYSNSSKSDKTDKDATSNQQFAENEKNTAPNQQSEETGKNTASSSLPGEVAKNENSRPDTKGDKAETSSNDYFGTGGVGAKVWPKVTEEDELFEYEQREDGTIYITGLKNKSVECLVIPEELFGVPVTEVGGWGFDGNIKLRELTIPRSVTYLRKFRNCVNLNKVTIKSDFLTEFDGAIFENCFNLKEFSLETTNPFIQTLTDYIISGSGIDERCFERFSSIPLSIKWSTLGELPIEEKLKWISVEDFYQQEAFTYEVVDGEAIITGVTKIPELSMPVVIPEILDGYPVTGIKAGMFDPPSTNYTVECLVIPGSIKVIESQIFEGNNSLKEVCILDGVTEIESRAFAYCQRLNTVSLPNTLIKIDGDAFLWCKSLENITLPEGLQIIKSAFEATPIKKIIVPESVQSFEFRNCEELTEITLPSNLTFIDSNAFSGCSSLVNIKIPDSVTEIERNAFRKCTGLQSIVIPQNVMKISEYAFEKCTILSEIIFEEDSRLETIGTSAFSETAISSIILPDNVKDFGYATFWDCPNLKTVYIKAGSETQNNFQKQYNSMGESFLRKLFNSDSDIEIIFFE